MEQFRFYVPRFPPVRNQETTPAPYDTFAGDARQHGVPAAVYVDRDSICRCQRLPTVAEQIAGRTPQTQFGPAMAPLGVELILAHLVVASAVLRCIADLESARRWHGPTFPTS